MPPRLGPARDDQSCSRAVSFLRKAGAGAPHRVGSTVLGKRTGATTRVLREWILAQQEEHANDMHDLLVTHEGRPILEK
jgi:hypothetical protein